MIFLLELLVWGIGSLILLLVAAAAAIIVYARWYRGTLEQTGVPVVEPHWFLGSNFDAHNRVQAFVDLERMHKYGHVYGVYDGRQPTIFVSDPKLMKMIQATDFEYFRNHRRILVEHPVVSEILDFIDDDKWREVRSHLTPQFTTGRIKVMCETISEITLDYVTELKKDMDDNGLKSIKMDFPQHCSPLVLEIIGKIFCGINIENARDPNNVFVKNMKRCLGGENEEGLEMPWTFTLATAVPILAKLFPVLPPGAIEMFSQDVTGILEGRDKSGVQHQDMVNTLLQMTKKAKTDPNYKRLGITSDTAMGQAFEFFLASYMAVRTSLNCLFYYFAIYPEIQERVRAEMADVMRKQGNQTINYETVSEMPFLTACLMETMRLQPSLFFRPDRRCTKDWEHNGLKIKKDMIVIFPLYAIHRDPNSYTDPESFDPDRFMPGRKEKLDPYTFGTFGNGPRACIGQRFSMQMLKIIAVHYMQSFAFQKREDTELKYLKGNPFFIKMGPIYVDFVKLSSK